MICPRSSSDSLPSRLCVPKSMSALSRQVAHCSTTTGKEAMPSPCCASSILIFLFFKARALSRCLHLKISITTPGSSKARQTAFMPQQYCFQLGHDPREIRTIRIQHREARPPKCRSGLTSPTSLLPAASAPVSLQLGKRLVGEVKPLL